MKTVEVNNTIIIHILEVRKLYKVIKHLAQA